MRNARSSRSSRRKAVFLREFMASFLAVALGGITALPIAAFLTDSLYRVYEIMFPPPPPPWCRGAAERAESLGIKEQWRQYGEAVRRAETTLSDHIEAVRSRVRQQPATAAGMHHAIVCFEHEINEARGDLWESCTTGTRRDFARYRDVAAMLDRDAAPRFPEGGSYRLIDDTRASHGLVIHVVQGRLCVLPIPEPSHSKPPQVPSDVTVSGSGQGPCLEVAGLPVPWHATHLRLIINVRTQDYELRDDVEGKGVASGCVRFLSVP
ncbi:MAG: hypothetical protein ACKO40_04820 [Planctomycetaceae bacterium]